MHERTTSSTRLWVLTMSTNTHSEPLIGAFVKDGRADAEIRDKRPGEIQIEYGDGDRIWLQKNRFQWNENLAEWRVV